MDVATPRPRRPWRGFLLRGVASALGLALAAFVFVAAIDPYGLRAGPGVAPTPIMDSDQRVTHPQLVRGGGFDSAVFGTSTVRLLDPAKLGALFGGRFVDLGLAAGTPWEQTRMADLFLGAVPAPRTLVFGLDLPWCGAEADRPEGRISPYGFPLWLYRPSGPALLEGYRYLFSLHALEVAGRVAAHRLGLLPAHTRADGYDDFLPPDATYDGARARARIAAMASHPPGAIEPAVTLGEADRAAIETPALAWLDGLLARLPPATLPILLLPPINVAAQPQPGSLAAARDAVCKARIAGIASARGALLLDLRRPSPATADDGNYWDPLHTRVGVADRLARAIHAACQGAPSPDMTFFGLLAEAPDVGIRPRRSCGPGDG